MFFATTEVPLLFKCNPGELRHDLFTVLCSINPHLFLEQIDLVSLFTSNAFADKFALSDLGNILEITMLVAGDSSLIWVPRFAIPSATLFAGTDFKSFVPTCKMILFGSLRTYL